MIRPEDYTEPAAFVSTDLADINSANKMWWSVGLQCNLY